MHFCLETYVRVSAMQWGRRCRRLKIAAARFSRWAHRGRVDGRGVGDACLHVGELKCIQILIHFDASCGMRVYIIDYVDTMCRFDAARY